MGFIRQIQVFSLLFFFLGSVCSAQQIDFDSEIATIDGLVETEDYEQAVAQIKSLQEAIVNTSYEEVDSVKLYILSKLAFVYYQLDDCELATANLKGEVDLRMEVYGPGEATTLQTMRNLGVYYLNCQENAQADSTLSQVIELHQENIGKIDELFVRTLDDLAFTKGKLGKVDEAVDSYEQLLKLLEHAGKGDFYFNVIENYSALLMNSERFEEAAPYYEELKEHMVSKSEYIQFLTDYYNVFVHLKDYVKAYETSSEIIEKCHESNCTATDLRSIKLNAARLAVLLNDYTEADRLYDLAENDGDETIQSEIQLLTERANVDGYLGRSFIQVGRLEKCLDLHVRNNLTDSDSYARVVLRLGGVLTGLGRFEKAETVFTNYIQTLQTNKDVDQEKLAQAYQSLGNQKYLLKDFNGADLYLNKARQTLLENNKQNNWAYASVLNSLGALQEGIANYEQAERYYKAGLEVVTMDAEGLSLSVALASNLANIMNSFTPENDSIEFLLSKAIGWQRNLTGENHPEYANLLNKRGLHLQAQGAMSDAEADYKKALEILDYTVGKSHPEYLSVLSNLGLLYDKQGKDEAALGYMLEANNLYKKFYADDNPGYVVAVNNLANTYTRLERYDDAAPLFSFLSDIVLKEIRESFSYLSEDEKKQFVSEKRKFQDNLKRYIMTRFTQDQNSVAPQMLAKWYELELNMKGILLNSTKRVRDQIFKSGDEALIGLFSEWSLARSKVAERQSLKSDLEVNQKQAMDSLSNRIANLEKEIARASSDFASSFALEELDFASVSGALVSGECGIEVIRTEVNGENITLLSWPCLGHNIRIDPAGRR